MDVTQFVLFVAVALVNLGLATAVSIRNSRSASNRAFAAVVVAIVGWLGAAFLWDQAFAKSQALFLNRLTLAMAMLMGMLLLRFALVFPSKTATLSRWWRSYFILGAALMAITLTTPAIVAGVGFRPDGTDVVAGPRFPAIII